MGAVRLPIVIRGKGPADLVERRADQLPVQLIPDKRPQVYTGRISLDLFYYLFILSGPVRI